jgi:bacterioferritin-associated ferredoxin
MGKFLAVILTVLAAAVVYAVEAADNAVEVKGPHICCGQCVKVATGILEKVDGVSDIKANQKTKIVTFTAKDDKAAKAGFKALVDGGFFGTATEGSKEIKLDLAAPKKGDKADVVTVKDVHVCCGQCQKAINKIFEGSKVKFEGSGPQKSVRIEGKNLDRAEVLETLHKTGFNGTVEK